MLASDLARAVIQQIVLTPEKEPEIILNRQAERSCPENCQQRNAAMANEIGCYIRLSHADDDPGEDQYESDSITNQRELIYRYLAAHPEVSGWRIREFVDDGYSGTSENRPEFQRLLEDAKQGRINCIVGERFILV